MGCWHGYGHGYGHGCGPGRYGVLAPSRDWCDLPDEDGWYDDVNWPLRRRARRPPVDQGARAAGLEAQLDELREEMRRIEAMLNQLGKPEGTGASG